MVLPFLSGLTNKKQVKRVIAIGGSKGGIGKTVVSVNLALALSRIGKSVVIFDADLGNANCHTLLGVRRIEKSLDDYLLGKASMEEMTVTTPFPNLKLICGASSKADQLLRDPAQKARLFGDLSALTYDFVLFDLGAGVGDEMLELYNLADEKIMVATSQFTALQNAYSFVKSAYLLEIKSRPHLNILLSNVGEDPIKLRNLMQQLSDSSSEKAEYAAVMKRQRFSIIGNMMNNQNDLNIIHKLSSIVKEYLGLETQFLGALAQSTEVQSSINKLTPFLELFPNCENSQELRTIAIKINSQQEAG